MLEHLIKGRANAEEIQQLRAAVESLRRDMDAKFSISKADIPRIEQQFLTSQKTRWHDFPWSNLFGAATLLGLVLYGSVGFGYSNFYYFLGVEMGEVGIGYTTVLSSTGI